MHMASRWRRASSACHRRWPSRCGGCCSAHTPGRCWNPGMFLPQTQRPCLNILRGGECCICFHEAAVQCAPLAAAGTLVQPPCQNAWQQSSSDSHSADHDIWVRPQPRSRAACTHGVPIRRAVIDMSHVQCSALQGQLEECVSLSHKSHLGGHFAVGCSACLKRK